MANFAWPFSPQLIEWTQKIPINHWPRIHLRATIDSIIEREGMSWQHSINQSVRWCIEGCSARTSMPRVPHLVIVEIWLHKYHTLYDNQNQPAGSIEQKGDYRLMAGQCSWGGVETGKISDPDQCGHCRGGLPCPWIDDSATSLARL